MRNFLRILGVVLAILVVGAWMATGREIGWSKTQVQVMQFDPITEIEFPRWENRLVLGVDFLVVGLLGSFAFMTLGVFWPRPKNSPGTSENIANCQFKKSTLNANNQP